MPLGTSLSRKQKSATNVITICARAETRPTEAQKVLGVGATDIFRTGRRRLTIGTRWKGSRTFEGSTQKIAPKITTPMKCGRLIRARDGTFRRAISAKISYRRARGTWRRSCHRCKSSRFITSILPFPGNLRTVVVQNGLGATTARYPGTLKDYTRRGDWVPRTMNRTQLRMTIN